MKATIKNRIVNDPAYPVIIEMYNKELQEKGKVNKKRFYEEVIKKKIPSYTMSAWYQFIKRFETNVGLVAVGVEQQLSSKQDADNGLQATLLTNEQATAKGIKAALNIGARFYNEILRKYQAGEILTKFEESCLKDAMFKAMKAQDSRIHAIGKVREDNREEQKLQKTFEDAAYGE